MKAFLFIASALIIGCTMTTPAEAPYGSLEAQFDQDCLTEEFSVCTCFPEEERPETIPWDNREVYYDSLCPLDDSLPYKVIYVE